MTHLRATVHAAMPKGMWRTRAGMALIAVLAGACSPVRQDDDSDGHNTLSSGSEMRMHVFTCEDRTSIVTGLSANTFVVDLIGATREDREQLTVPRAQVRTADGRLTVMIGQDRLHLERIGKQGINEHLSFRGKSCWR
ncbi:hypothetical protein NI18_00345 [Sphingomonas sp. Ant20]|jgi:hypothetical protein|nr:hypothetical protein NI18_00345 [Sphingomonas sp. Ant20]